MEVTTTDHLYDHGQTSGERQDSLQQISTVISLDTPSRPACEFCAKIVDYFYQIHSYVPGETTVDLGNLFEILGTQCPHVEWVGNLRFMVYRLRENVCEIYRPKDMTNLRGSNLCLERVLGCREKYASLSPRLEDGGPLTMLVDPGGCFSPWCDLTLIAREDIPDHPGSLRALDPKWIDLGLARGWYKRCTDGHASCEKPTHLEGLELVYPDWLVDVDQGCLVPFTTDKKVYFTLSYTWGQTTTLRNIRDITEELQQPGVSELRLMYLPSLTLRQCTEHLRCRLSPRKIQNSGNRYQTQSVTRSM